MPCFKGIAVSVHANGAPLPEHGMQKQSRMSRISTYIPVPQPKLEGNSTKPEPAKFAISITLLTPGLAIPYSAPKATDTNPYPKPQFVGELHPSSQGERGKYAGMVTPYIPMTNSENETIAAYIYFDGRAKEEVATLLRPGEETWVNSRWVQVPDAEGGGLAEREFLFREVGLERWLNGLDLQGQDVAEKLERRRQKFEKRRQRQGSIAEGTESEGKARQDTMRYGAEDGSPLEAVLDSDSLSSDDDEPPEATGQIKVAMFRVLASGEIKKGEYSPQFDAHDGDEEGTGGTDGNGMTADVEHTTSFAKPKTLDPKTISTQTVTGIDGPDKPYATFTFFYRGDRQLQKIGVIQGPKSSSAAQAHSKRRSGTLDFSSIAPLKSGGTVGFSAFRDKEAEDAARRNKARKKSNGNIADDSDDDDDDDMDSMIKMDDDKDNDGKVAPEDAKSGGELADGVNRIRLKRAHSADPEGSATPEATQTAVPDVTATPQRATGASVKETEATPAAPKPPGDTPAEAAVGSPLKRARPSVDLGNPMNKFSATQSLSAALGSAMSGSTNASSLGTSIKMEEEEEL
ncbi:Putative Beta-lactamase-type transpeptidase fold domain containing protein [[Torrubiella] hemipterigena]|uniref:Putative Beta-lactamase-type transpeptidase fold domain containing protein n=1 Tax=[Torrubiella] hemipterigena TaxID=1531966 RepID=A0A0A1TK59_9HYPO|nr:Putative Beta-lactamase-type transpeptidase fold domain containing protein [[Torrubiella] hemipterigena]